MATFKNCTDLPQSKKLAKFLPIESADMFYVYDRRLDKLYGDIPYLIGYKVLNKYVDIPCWSLVALLNILDFPALTQEDENEWEVCVRDYNNDEYIEIKADNPIDACVDMILLCKEHNLL